MQVILLKDISGMGKRGDVKDVANGYALNVLIPKGFVVRATSEELAKWKQKEDSKKHKKELETNVFAQLIDRLRSEKIVISGKKKDGKGQLFAQIKEKDIVDAIYTTTKISVNEKQIHILKPIKSIGLHQIELKQGAKKELLNIEIK